MNEHSSAADAKANDALERALQLSRDLAVAAADGNWEALAKLDVERLQLLKSYRSGSKRIDAQDRVLLQEIAALNDRAIGCTEHHQRIKGRELDMAAVGRRAVAAYFTTRQRP